jgi:integrase
LQVVDTFTDSLRSKHTKEQYQYQLKQFIKFIGDIHSIRYDDNIIRYLLHMKEEGLSYSYRNLAFSAIKHYYFMNDIVLNWKKLSKFLGENTYDNTLRGYTHEEIQRLLDVANVKYKAIILTLASTGMRREALVGIKQGDMEYVEEYQLYKITIYRRTKEQQICFTTPEAAKAIDLHFRTGYFHDIQAHTISETMRNLAIKAGIITAGLENRKRGQYRNEIPCVHGLRKFAATQMGRSDMKVEAREILLGHSIGVRAAYQKYSDEDLLTEYLKAVDNLTINEENRMKIALENLNTKISDIEAIKKEIGELRSKIGISP